MSDPMTVIVAARNYRTAVRRTMTQGSLPARQAQQELFDALNRYDGTPTEREQAVLDNGVIAASIERHQAEVAKRRADAENKSKGAVR